MRLHQEASHGLSEESWKARYPNRAHLFQYAHLYFYLKKA